MDIGLGGLLAAVGLEAQAVTVKRRRTGEEVSIPNLLSTSAKEGTWLVAWDDGEYELAVADLRLCFSVSSKDKIQAVLSHRWAPSVTTASGQIPIPMMQASYSEATWIDCLNHFNIEKYKDRVKNEMGALYAAIPCRALYLEGDSTDQMVEACTRAWMWQELSVGPQAQRYKTAEAACLHFVIELGPVDALKGVGYLAIPPDVSSCAIAFVQKEHNRFPEGTLGAALEQVLSSSFMFHKELDGLVTVLVEELGEDTPAEDGLSQWEKIVQWLHATIAWCVHKVVGARKTRDARTLRLAPDAVTLMALTGARANTDEPAMRIVLAVLKMIKDGFGRIDNLQAELSEEEEEEEDEGSGRRTGKEKSEDKVLVRALKSAAGNLANQNVTHDDDRLVASFGVICSLKGVPCTPASANAVLRDAPAAYVACVEKKAAAGVAGAVKRRVKVEITDKQRVVDDDDDDEDDYAMQAIDAAVGVVTGRFEEEAIGKVALNGWSLGLCTIEEGKDLVEVLDVRRWTAEPGAGEITSYSFSGGMLQSVYVKLETGATMHLISEDKEIEGRAFFEWLLQQEECC